MPLRTQERAIHWAVGENRRWSPFLNPVPYPFPMSGGLRGMVPSSIEREVKEVSLLRVSGPHLSLDLYLLFRD